MMCSTPEITLQLPDPPTGKTGWPWDDAARVVMDTAGQVESQPRISIVTPSFNQAAYLEETIRSVLLQGYPNLEYMIIDGGSKDGSLGIIQKYAPWLAYWESTPDRGQAHAINKGFERATGEIITFQNSDDLYLPGAFAEAARLWPEWKDHGALVGGFVYIDERSQRTDELERPPQLPGAGPHDLSLGIPYRLHQVATFFNRQALDAVGRWLREDLQYTLDRELLFRVARQYPIYCVNQALGAFRRHTTSKSVSQILPFAEEFARLHLLFIDGNPARDRLRRQAARTWMGRGYVKFALARPGSLAAASALLGALRFRPGYMLQAGYYNYWLRALNLKTVHLGMPTLESE
jgi:glycosyltransferase involved in cell wall biosynthesis